MVCSNCGAPIPENSAFCVMCGTPVAKEETEEVATEAVVEEADNDLQKARPSILAKLAEFGSDVASNIVANILTNPTIWQGLF